MRERQTHQFLFENEKEQILKQIQQAYRPLYKKLNLLAIKQTIELRPSISSEEGQQLKRQLQEFTQLMRQYLGDDSKHVLEQIFNFIRNFFSPPLEPALVNIGYQRLVDEDVDSAVKTKLLDLIRKLKFCFSTIDTDEETYLFLAVQQASLALLSCSEIFDVYLADI